MKEAKRALKILTMVYEHGIIQGRTRLQKLVFLLKNKYEIPLSFDFTSYYYGPYSSGLSDYIDSMISYGLLEEKRVHLGKDIDRYDYHLTEKGRNLLQEQVEKEFQEDKPIANAITKLKEENTSKLVKEAKDIMSQKNNNM